MRRKNLDALERVEREKVRVAGDDVGGMAAHSEFEELVVFGIAASCYLHVHADPLSLARQSGEKTSNILLINISPELFSAQDFVEFGERGKREQDFALSEREIKSLARLRIGQKQRTN